MKKIIICNTYYQFILALQMKLTIFADDYVALILTDQTKGLLDIYNRLIKDNQLFGQTYYFKTKDFSSRKDSATGYLKDIIHTTIGTNNFNILKDQSFEEFVFYNCDYSTLAIYDVLKKNNKQIKSSRFEEGILSYNRTESYGRLNLILKLRILVNKDNIYEQAKIFYCVYPELYGGYLDPLRIPEIEENSPIVNYIRKYFGIMSNSGERKERYIFLTSVYDFEGGSPIHEIDVAKKVAELVGINNLLIKIHPRDTRGVYEAEGFHVDKNSSIPWEVILLVNKLNNKVFLTATSGSVMSTNLIMKDKPKSFFLFNFCDIGGNKAAKYSISSIFRTLNSPVMKEKVTSIKIAEKLEEIL